MFRELKKLIGYINLLPTILKSILELKERVDKLDIDTKKYPNIYFGSHELYLVRDTFNLDLRSENIKLFSNIRLDIDKCINKYDNYLYLSTDIVSNDPLELMDIISKLEVLREYILECLFAKSDIFSFYLYFVNTEALRSTLTEIPTIDIDKVFMLEVGDSNVDTIDVENYVTINITRSTLTISTPIITHEVSLKYKKTILRVLYSIYTNKLHLYHLD